MLQYIIFYSMKKFIVSSKICKIFLSQSRKFSRKCQCDLTTNYLAINML